MQLAQTAAIITAAIVSILFCVGLGWGPTGNTDSVPLALLGLTAAGLAWPAIILKLVRRGREVEQRQP
jgi:hypothetical protein